MGSSDDANGWLGATLRPDRAVLLYDDECRFCRAMAELIYRLARPRELAVLPWSSDVAGAWLAGLRPEVRDASMHLLLANGSMISGKPVFEASLAHVRGLRWLAALAGRSRIVSAALGGGYGWAARNRSWLSRFVPDRPAVRREPHLS